MCVLITFIASFFLLFFKSEKIVKTIEDVIKFTVIGGVSIQIIICFSSSLITIFHFINRLRKRRDPKISNEVTNVVSIAVSNEKI